MAEVNARSFRGYRPLRNENPRMGVRGGGLEGEDGMIGLLDGISLRLRNE